MAYFRLFLYLIIIVYRNVLLLELGLVIQNLIEFNSNVTGLESQFSSCDGVNPSSNNKLIFNTLMKVDRVHRKFSV